MTIDATTLTTICGMAAVTYGSRAGGLWAVRRLPMTARTKAWLEALPGAILISIVAPPLLAAGTLEVLAAGLTAIVAWFSRSVLAAMLVGVAAVWFLRQTIG